LLTPRTDLNNVAAAIYDVASGVWTTAAAPSNTKLFGCDSVGWNGDVAICNELDYMFVISMDPLTVVPFPTLLDDQELWLQFTPVNDLFFAWGGEFSSPATGSRGFLVNPRTRTWGAATPSPLAPAPWSPP
jgi:hypothetical protein